MLSYTAYTHVCALNIQCNKNFSSEGVANSILEFKITLNLRIQITVNMGSNIRIFQFATFSFKVKDIQKLSTY